MTAPPEKTSIEIRGSFAWKCSVCNAEQFVYGTIEGLGSYLVAPKLVKCETCGRNFVSVLTSTG